MIFIEPSLEAQPLREASTNFWVILIEWGSNLSLFFYQEQMWKLKFYEKKHLWCVIYFSHSFWMPELCLPKAYQAIFRCFRYVLSERTRTHEREKLVRMFTNDWNEMMIGWWWWWWWWWRWWCQYVHCWTFLIFMLMMMLDLWPQAETPGVTHFGAYHRHPDGHFLHLNSTEPNMFSFHI